MAHWSGRLLILLWCCAFAVIMWAPIETNGLSSAQIVAQKLAR